MELTRFLEIFERLYREGWAVIDQFKCVVEGEPLNEQNPNALKIIADILEDMSDEIPEAEVLADTINTYLDKLNK